MPIRQDILDKLRTDLAAITTGNGYNYTITKVYRERKDFGQINHNELPAVFLQPLEERSTMGESLIENNWSIGLIYYLKISDDTTEAGVRETTIEKVIADIKSKLYNRASTIYTLDIETLFIGETDAYELTDDFILVTFII